MDQDWLGHTSCKGTACEAGKYFEQAARNRPVTCKLCPTGQFQSSTGAQECQACPLGRSTATGTVATSSAACVDATSLRCTGASAALDVTECVAWRSGYDAMGGAGWTHCFDSATIRAAATADSCALSIVAPLPLGVRGGSSVVHCTSRTCVCTTTASQGSCRRHGLLLAQLCTWTLRTTG